MSADDVIEMYLRGSYTITEAAEMLTERLKPVRVDPKKPHIPKRRASRLAHRMFSGQSYRKVVRKEWID
jgi:hypothetical protein